MVVLSVLAFLLSAGAGFIVVQRLTNSPQVTTAKNNPSTATGKSNGVTGKAPERPLEDGSGQLSASDILKRVGDTYSALDSYSAEGTVVTDMDMSKVDFGNLPGVPPELAAKAKASKEAQAALASAQHIEGSFTMRLSRPGLYRVDWNSQVGPMKQTGAVWSSGDGDYLFMGIKPPKYVKLQSREVALGAAAGVSQGAANSIPSIFFNNKGGLFQTLENVSLEKEENIDGADCYLVSGEVRGLKMNLWIDKGSFLIKRKQQVFGGEVKMPKMSDQDVDTALKQLGGGATAEKRAQMKKMMESMQKMATKMKGSMTETYRNIEANKKLSKDEFTYKVPAGVELGGSLF